MPSSAPPVAGFDRLYYAALLLYALYAVFDLAGFRQRAIPLGMGVALHLVGTWTRARAIDYFPLTNKFESFYGFSLAVFACSWLIERAPSRVHRLSLWGVGMAFYLWTFRFERGAFFPPPLMMTVFYPLHVPGTFASYALWGSAASAGLAVLLGARDAATLELLDQHAFYGFSLFGLSMIFGGAWGYVAWGAYFLWDPKVVWSVILWLFYAGFVHLRYWPRANRPTAKSVLALAGFLAVLVAYVGTSFLFRHGSHSFG